MTTWLAGFALFFAICALITGFVAVRLALFRTGSHASSAKFAQIEAEMTDQASALQAIRDTLTKIRARLNAQSRRTAKSAPEHDMSTPEGRDAARAELERELTAAGKLNPKIHQMR